MSTQDHQPQSKHVSHFGYSVQRPPTTPVLSLGEVKGPLAEGTEYVYAFSYLTHFGETDPSATSKIVAGRSGSVRVSLESVSDCTGVVARRLYRTKSGESQLFLLATVPNTACEAVVDTTPDKLLSTPAPTANFAHSVHSLNGVMCFALPVSYNVDANVVACGSNIEDARVLSSQYNWVTVSTPGAGVRLPSSFIGQSIKIRNDTPNFIKVFPFPGQRINDGLVDVSFLLGHGLSMEFVYIDRVDGPVWRTI